MALDFNNRNPQDPNGIYSLDTSGATDAWVKDDDWSQIYYSPAEARKNGANNKIRVATAVTNEGRKYNVVVGANGQPISQAGDVIGTDDDVARRWQQNAPKPLPPGSQRTRNVNGRVMAYNPASGLYDIDEGAVPAQKSEAEQAQEAAQAQTAQETAKNAAELQRQREANAALPKDQDPAYETDAERRKRAEDRIRQQGEDARRAEADARQKAADARAEADRNKPGAPTLKPDGKGGTIAVQTMPDGSIKTTPLPGVPSDKPNPERVTVEGVVYERDPQTGAYKPAEGLPVAGQMPAGVPQYTPDLTKPGAGLIDYAKSLDEWMAANPGKLTWEKRQQLVESAVKMGGQIASEFNSAATMLREDYSQRASQRNQDVQQANSRATLANSHYQNAVGLVEKFAPYLGVTPGDAGKLFMGMMASQLATATMYGGMRDVPREDMNPQLRGWAEQTVGRSLAPTGAAIPPGPGEAAGPVAAGVAATNAAAANPTGANVQAATDATMQGSAAAFGALGIPPANPDPRAVEAAFRATGQPLPAPLIGPTPLTPAIPEAPAQTGQAPSFIDNTVWQQAPQPVGMGLPAPMAGGNAGVGEALFGKSLPEPSSWRQDAEDRMYALTMPQQQAYSAGSGLFGASLPPALTQPSGGIDYGLSMPQGNGGMGAIDAEARRQLAAAGIMV